MSLLSDSPTSTPKPKPKQPMPAAPKNSRQKIRLGDLLVEHNVISEAQLTQSLQEQKRTGNKLGHTLQELGFADEMRILEVLSTQLNIPFVELANISLNLLAVQMLPEAIARRYRVIVLEDREHDVLVGMADPTDLFATDEISRILKKRIKQAVIRESDLLKHLDIAYHNQNELLDIAGELNEELGHNDVDLSDMLQSTDTTDAPVFRLLQSLFEDAVRVNASDIHIEPEENALRIRKRIDGILQEQVMKEVKIAQALVQKLKLLAQLDISEKRLPQDGRFRFKLQNRQVDVRLSTLPIQAGEAVVMRLLDQTSGILSLEELGIEQDLRTRFDKIIHRPHGLILVTGPTGSGKTTTLYAALNSLNSAERKIITVEDPVEYRLNRVNQVQVHEKIGLTFARVLRTALRQDPDVILVGEMRDVETAQIGLRASITGHLVLSTLHTNSAIDTISRLLDMGIPGYLMASALQAVLAQRLIRKICPDCIQEHPLDEHEKAWVLALEHEENIAFKTGKGCPLCNNTGYRGRIGVYELLEVKGDSLVALRNEDIEEFGDAARKSKGFIPLSESAFDLAKQGITSLEEAIRITGGDE